MNSIDRKTQPEIKTISNAGLIKPESAKLDNGVMMFYFNAGTQDVIKLDCLFDAGSWYQEKKLTAFSTVKMLAEGTRNMSAAGISEIFDSYGAYIAVNAEKDYASVTLYSLSKHLETLLPVFAEIMRESVFPQYELSVLMAKSKQEQLVLMQQVNTLAKMNFAEQLFGVSHPYGQNASVEDFNKVTPEDLVDFCKKYYHPSNLRIVASGKINENSVALINKFLGDKSWKSGSRAVMKEYKTASQPEKKKFISKEGALQSGLRIGKILFTKRDPDYFGMTILNTILGGYFGSRLMTNIREDKGYTYGIASGIISFRNEGMFYIASEVGTEVREKAIAEIYKEINILRNDPVSDKELSLVKNYLTGSFLRSIDGPFALAERFTAILDYGFSFNDFYERYIGTISEITPQQLTILANKYLAEDSFYETVAG